MKKATFFQLINHITAKKAVITEIHTCPYTSNGVASLNDIISVFAKWNGKEYWMSLTHTFTNPTIECRVKVNYSNTFDWITVKTYAYAK